MEGLCKDCYKQCPYFPDFYNDSKNLEYDINEDGVKIMKKHKKIKCLYDFHNLDFYQKCPFYK